MSKSHLSNYLKNICGYIWKDFVVAEAIQVALKLALSNSRALSRHLLFLKQAPKMGIASLGAVNIILSNRILFKLRWLSTNLTISRY